MRVRHTHHGPRGNVREELARVVLFFYHMGNRIKSRTRGPLSRWEILLSTGNLVNSLLLTLCQASISPRYILNLNPIPTDTVATTSHQRDISLEQLKTTTETHNWIQCRDHLVVAVYPQWAHQYHTFCIYGLRQMYYFLLLVLMSTLLPSVNNIIFLVKTMFLERSWRLTLINWHITMMGK